MLSRLIRFGKALSDFFHKMIMQKSCKLAFQIHPICAIRVLEQLSKGARDNIFLQTGNVFSFNTPNKYSQISTCSKIPDRCKQLTWPSYRGAKDKKFRHWIIDSS